jgi:hypothetical protein
VFPRGADGLEDEQTDALKEFVAEVVDALASGAEILATLPLPTPGQAVLLLARTEVLE